MFRRSGPALLDNRVALVTTNFDTLFERALEAVDGPGKARNDSFAGQALPLPGAHDFGGIIHLHGRLGDAALGLASTSLVLTSAEYGEAYMRAGWAARFLFDLVRCRTLVLVGYSASDAPIRYFLNVLEADRERFQDLKPVYALDMLDEDHDDQRWTTIAVRPLNYRKARAGAEGSHASLWRDLASLADLVEQPKAWRKARAAAVTSAPFDTVSEKDRTAVDWVVGGNRELMGVAMSSVVDPRWFDHFIAEKVWSEDDAAWVLAAWCGLDWTNPTRLDAAIGWRGRLGRIFGEALKHRLAFSGPADPLFRQVWHLLARAALRPAVSDVEPYRVSQVLASESCTDADLRASVELLRPFVEILDFSRRWSIADRKAQPETLDDLVILRLDADTRADLAPVATALRQKRDRMERILELATEVLRSALIEAVEVGLIQPGLDRVESSVPAVELHDQNEFRGGPIFLLELLSDLFPDLAAQDRSAARLLAETWSGLPGLLGPRLFLQALRDRRAFTDAEVGEQILALGKGPFWGTRRELILAMSERLVGATVEVGDELCRRILAEGPHLYEDIELPTGQTDWRQLVRDHEMWLRLTALDKAGQLSTDGQTALSAIFARNPAMTQNIEERDLFRSYSTGVHSVVGRADLLQDAPVENRIALAQQFATDWDPNVQRNWSAYCSTDPEGAFDALVAGGLAAEQAPLWRDLIGALTWPPQAETPIDKARRNANVRRVFEHLRDAADPFMAEVAARLADLLAVARAAGLEDADAWWDRLWTVIEQTEVEPLGADMGGRFFDRVINRPSGRLAEHLITTIGGRKTARTRISAVDRDRLRRVMTSPTTAGWLGRGILVQQAGFVHFLDAMGSRQFLKPWLRNDDAQGETLRAVLVEYGRLAARATAAYKKELLKAVRESQASGEAAAHVAASVLRPLLVGAATGQKQKWGLTEDEVSDALKRASASVLEGAARTLQVWVKPTDIPPEQAWRESVGPVFKAIWPKTRRYKSPGLSRSLAAACIDAGPAFPEAFGILRPYLSPYGERSGGLYFMERSQAPEDFPAESLELLWILCGPANHGQVFELGKILDRLSAAAPQVVRDRRFQWLEQAAIRFE